MPKPKPSKVKVKKVPFAHQDKAREGSVGTRRAMCAVANSVAKATLSSIELIAEPDMKCAMAVDVGGMVMITGMLRIIDEDDFEQLLKEVLVGIQRQVNKRGVQLTFNMLVRRP